MYNFTNDIIKICFKRIKKLIDKIRIVEIVKLNVTLFLIVKGVELWQKKKSQPSKIKGSL